MNIERLEPRTLFTAVLPFSFVQTGAALKVTGNNNTASTATDQIQLTQSGGVITATDIRSGASIATTGTAITSIVVDLGNGNDYLRLRNNDGTKPVTVSTNLLGGAGNDTIYGGDGVDLIQSGDGDDKISGRGGNDTLDGGNGFDTADYSYETRAINVSLDGAPNDGVISIGEHDNVVCEAVVGGSGNDILIGNASSADWLDGGAGNDTIAGGGGNDTLTGGIGADAILGQAGSDSAFIKDGTVDNTGDVLETAQIDSKNAGAAVNDVAANIPAPVSQASALAAFGASVAASVTVNPDGSANLSNPANLDTTFGVDTSFEYHGVSVPDIGGYGEIRVAKVLLQPTEEFTSEFVDPNGTSTDKILVVGTIYGFDTPTFDFFVMRLNKDGTLDTSFGDGTGIATADFTDVSGTGVATDDFATSATLDSSGNIFVAGYSQVYVSESESYNSDVSIAEFNATDGSQGEFGKVLYDAPDVAGAHQSQDSATGIVVDWHDYGDDFFADVVTVVADVQASTGEKQVAMLQFDAVGNSDPFGFDSTNLAYGAQIQSAGIAEDGAGNYWIAVTRFNEDESLSPGVIGFASNGVKIDSFENFFDPNVDGNLHGVVNGIAVHDDRIVLVGRADTGSGFIAGGDILNTEGTYVGNTFTTFPTSPSGYNFVYNDVAFDSSGRAVAIGNTQSGDGHDDYIVSRFDAGLQEDLTFNDGVGSVEIDPQGGYDEGHGVLIQDDGAIVVGGLTHFSEDPGSVSVVRLIGGDPVAGETIDSGTDAGTAQTLPQFQWIPDPATDPTGTPRPIPLELFEHAIRESEKQVPLVIYGTQEDDYISVTSTFDDAGNGIFRVNINGAEDDWDRRFISEVDINTFGGKDVVRINDLLYNLPIDPNTNGANLLDVNITGQKNNLTVFLGSTPDGAFGRSITYLNETDPTLGTVVQPPDPRLDDDPHTPLVDADGNDIPPDPVMIWEAGDNIGGTRLDYTETYPDFGYTQDASININLLDANAPPLAGDDSFSSIPKNTIQVTFTSASLLANDSAGPVSESGQTLTIDNVFDGVGGTVSLDTSGAEPVVIFTPETDYTGPASFTYEIIDGNVPDGTVPHTALGTVTFDIVNSNHSPTDIALDNASIPENSLANSLVGHLTTTDPDVGDSFTYTLVAGVGADDNNAFTISGDKLIAKNPFDFEPKSSYLVRVQTSDGQNTFEKAFVIAVTDVNEAPTDLALAPAAVDENLPVGTAVGTFSSTDPDLSDTFTYTLVSGTGSTNNTSFTISNVGGVGTLKTNAIFDFETKNSYSVRVRTTDANGLWVEKALTITINNVNEAPTANAGGPYNVVQGSSVALTGLASTDPEQASSSLTYSWDLDGDGVFGETAISNTNGIPNGDETGATPTYITTGATTLGQHTIYLKVYDNGALMSSTSAIVNVNSAAPVDVKLTGTIIGTAGSYQNKGNTRDKAFDGNLNSFFDAPENEHNGAWVGLDLVTAKKITDIKFAPRAGFEGRMYGGLFQASNDPNFKTGVVTLGTVNSVPVAGQLTDLPVTNPGTFRYVRYLSPAGGYGNIAELAFYTGAGDTVPPSTPGTPVQGTVTSTTVAISWPASTDNVAVARYDIYRDGNKVGSSTNTSFTDINLTANTTYSYRVLAIDTSGNQSPAQSPALLVTTASVPVLLTGSYIGTAGSYQNKGNVGSNAFDGNTGTYFDSPTASGGWVGLDFGSAKIVTQIKFYPRAANASRMTGGMFQGSNDPTFASYTTLYTITGTPAANTFTTVTPTVIGSYRYVRYIGPANSYSNIAEAQFYGQPAAPDNTPPSTPGKPVQGTVTATTVAISWPASSDNVGISRYDIYRDGNKVGSSTNTSFTDINLIASTTYSYTVLAIDTSGNPSAAQSPALSVTTAAAVSVKLTGTYIGTTGSYQNAGNVGNKVFDGNTGTFFDAPSSSGSWVGLDLGSAKTITQIRFYPRASFAYRMDGGTFQASNDPTFATYTTLYTVSGTPAANGYTTVAVNSVVAFRYVRYVGPAGGYGNIAEAEFYGM